jgi:hypothetical protein
MRYLLILVVLLMTAACVETIPPYGTETNDPIGTPGENEGMELPDEEEVGIARIVELSRYASIYEADTVIIHDRRASSNRAVNAPWMWETQGEGFANAEGISFIEPFSGEEVSIWVRMYSERNEAPGWSYRIGDQSGTIEPEGPMRYEWIEIARGTFRGDVPITLAPLGPRSRIDVLGVTSGLDPNALDPLLELVEPAPIPQAEIYVAMDGSDTSAGTETRPLRTIQAAIDTAEPGDTIIVREGRYGGFIIREKSGRADAWITLMAYPGERVIIDIELTDSKVAAIQIHNPSRYWVFDGFEITDSDPRIDEVRSLDIRREPDQDRFRAFEKGDHRWGVRIFAHASNEPSTDLIFRNLEIHHLFGTGIIGNGHRFHQYNNHIYDLGYPASGYAWYSSGSDHRFRNNIIHDVVRALQSNSPAHPERNLLFEQNLMYRTGTHLWFHSSGTIKHHAVAISFVDGQDGNNTVRNNIFVHNGLSIFAREDETIAHNAFIGQLSNEHPVVTRDSSTIVNNVFSKTRRTIDARGSDNAIHSNHISDAPGYRDPGSLDFTLVENAPIIGAGVDHPIRTDFTGRERDFKAVGPIATAGEALP